MKPGEVIETAIWLDGTETAADRARFEADCTEAMSDLANQQRLILAPIVWTEHKPGEDRVPPVPDHIKGPDVRLLVAEALILSVLPEMVTRSFLLDLETKDLLRLRALTRRSHKQARPTAARLTDEECDKIIEEIGPQAAYDAVRKAVDTRVIH